MALNRVIREYSGEWEISRSGPKNITPLFSPLPDADLSFQFSYQHADQSKPQKLTLHLRGKAKVNPSLRMDVEVSLGRSVGCISVQYESVYAVNIQREVEINFHETKIISPINERTSFILSCKMKFWDISLSSTVQKNKDNKLGAQPYSPSDLKLFVKNFTIIFESKELSDVKFILGKNTLHAHKFVLAAHSPVFMTMLKSDFKESRTDTITITDSTFEVFGDFLKYLYSGEIADRTWNKMRELFKLADKYDVKILKRECQKTISSFLNMDTVCEVLVLAHHYDDAELKNAAKEYAFTRMKELMTKPKWKELDVSHPRIAKDMLMSFIQHQK